MAHRHAPRARSRALRACVRAPRGGATTWTCALLLVAALLLVGVRGALAAPSPVSGVWAVPGDGQVTLSWEPSAGSTSYRIYESTSAGTTGSLVATVAAPSTTYVRTGRANGTRYFYSVRGYDGATESGNPVTGFTTAATMPSGRSIACVGVVDGTIYVMGGYVGSGGPALDSIMSVNPILGTASTIAQVLPSTRDRCGTADANGKLYLLGGENASGTVQSSILEFTPGSNGITKSGTLPGARTNAAAVNLGGQIYLYGGDSGSSGSTAIYRYNPVADTAPVLDSNLPSNLTALTVSRVDGQAYVVGGEDFASQVPETDVTRHTSGTVTVRSPMLNARSYGAAAGVNQVVYQFAGEDGVVTAVDKHDTASNTSSTMAINAPDGVVGARAVSIRGFVYLLGGRSGTTFPTAVRRFDPGGQASATANASAATAPSALTVTPAAGQATVSWTAGSNVHWYRVFRSTVAGELGSLIEEAAGVVNAPRTSIIDSGLTYPGTTYYYTVTAVGYDDRETAATAQVETGTSPPDTLFTHDTNAQAGATNPTGILYAAPHFSWLNNSGTTATLERTQVMTTPADNVLALWRFENNGADSSGNGRTLTGVGAPGYAASRNAAFGQGATLDGTSQHFTRTDAGLDLANNFTVEAWIKLPGGIPAGSRQIVEKGTMNDRNFTLYVQNGTGALVGMATVGGVDKFVPATTNVADGNWHHVAMTVDSGNTMRLYVDGVIDRAAFALGGPITGGMGLQLSVGKWGVDAGGYFPGTIDDVRISRVTHSAAELLGYIRTMRQHNEVLWDSDTSDAGRALSSCATGVRCADIVYGSGGSTPVALTYGGARYYARSKVKPVAGSWSGWASPDWFETGPNTGPNAPGTPLNQFRNDGTTTIASGAWTPDGISNNVVLKFTVSDPNASQALTPWVEVVPSSGSFGGTCGTTGSGMFSGAVVSAPSGGTSYNATVNVTGLTAGTTYKWHACSVDQSGALSGWTVRGSSPDFGAGVTVTAVSPTSVLQGASGVTLQVTGTSFQNGATGSISGTGVTVTSTTWVSATRVDLVVNVTGTATASARDVTISNPDTSTATGTGLLTVTAPTLTIGMTTLGYGDGARTTVAPFAVALGNQLPGTTRQMGPTGSGQTTAGAAVSLSLNGDVGYRLDVQATDLTSGGNTLAAGQLAWKRNGVTEAWTPFTTGVSTVSGPHAAGARTIDYDYQLTLPPTQAPGTYTGTVTYTITASP